MIYKGMKRRLYSFKDEWNIIEEKFFKKARDIEK